MRIRRFFLIGFLCIQYAIRSGQADRITPELLWDLGRLGDVTLSKKGHVFAYTIQRYELSENKGKMSLYVCHIDDETHHKTHRCLIENWTSLHDVQFALSPFGERIFFVGQRDEKDEVFPQVWSLNYIDGGLLQVTDIEEGVSNLKVSPIGKHLAFTYEVKMDKDINDRYKDLPKAEARIIDTLLFRHWDRWHNFKYTHLHIAALGKNGRAKKAIDLMSDWRADCPLPPFGGAEQYAWSPDGKEIAFTAKGIDRWAESTNSDVYLVQVSKPDSLKNITRGMDGYDKNPRYSHDGNQILFQSMKRAGFESDRNRIMIYNRSTETMFDATKGLDQTTHGAEWSPDGERIFFTSELGGTDQLFEIAARGGALRQLSEGRFHWKLRALFPDGKRALMSFMNMERPNELAILSLDSAEMQKVSDINGEIFKGLSLPKIESRHTQASDGKAIHSWVIYPPDFSPEKKWPLLTYCQGGPQGQVGQWFSYRWNFHLMAANGYVVIAPNRRGLPGFGREWNDQISGDWGGQAMQDLLSATDAMLDQSYIDADRSAVIGASFGGYSVFWLMGNHENRFKAMIAHCGVFNLESMYGSTEELFFMNWDLGGPYWKSENVQADYDRFSPHRFVKNWQTPLLIIHGEKDFRVPVTQGIEAFTAAQIMRIPSRFLYFPNEGHWVLKPQNGVLWHRIFFDWLDRYCPPNQKSF